MIYWGDCREVMSMFLDDDTVDCCVTSPPYWGLRDYGVSGQLGLEENPEDFVTNMVQVFREVRRVLKPDGTLWLNLGDSYAGSGKGRSSDGLSCATGSKQATNKGAVSGRLTRPAEIPGLKSKDLVGIPWRVAFALQRDGWYLRQDIIWAKPNPMPESVRDRCTKAHEYIFLLSKSDRYFFDVDAIKEKSVTNDARRPYGSKGAWDLDQRPEDQRHGGKPRVSKPKGSFQAKGEPLPGQLPFRAVTELRHKRSVWNVTTKSFKGAHFATFPPDLIEPCILAGSKPNGIVLDPFFGAGTTGVVATKHGRSYIGIELNKEYIGIAQSRLGVAL